MGADGPQPRYPCPKLQIGKFQKGITNGIIAALTTEKQRTRH